MLPSLLVSIFAPVHAPLAVAQVGALHARIEALAILFEAMGFFAIAPSLVGQLGLLSSHHFELVTEGVGVPL